MIWGWCKHIIKFLETKQEMEPYDGFSKRPVKSTDFSAATAREQKNVFYGSYMQATYQHKPLGNSIYFQINPFSPPLHQLLLFHRKHVDFFKCIFTLQNEV